MDNITWFYVSRRRVLGYVQNETLQAKVQWPIVFWLQLKCISDSGSHIAHGGHLADIVGLS